MAKRIHHLHDKFVKASFSDKDRAASFFEKNLPETLLHEIDLSTLRPMQESYIQGMLDEHFSDMVFEVKSTSGEAIELILLFEHKSAPDKYILMQVGHYMFSHWFRCVHERRELKLIIPLIYYQGKKEWKAPELHEMFPKNIGSLSSYIPVLHHIFIALNSLPDENIKLIKNRMMAAAILAQKKGINIMKLTEDIIKIFELFPEDERDGNFLEQIFVYIVSVSDIPKPEFTKAIESVPAILKNNIMTTYTRIKEEGKEEGKIEVILNGYENGLSTSILSNITQLSEDKVENILRKHSKID